MLSRGPNVCKNTNKMRILEWDENSAEGYMSVLEASHIDQSAHCLSRKRLVR